jgi:hypothetical protein
MWKNFGGNSRSAAPLAWGLIPLLLLIGILIFFFGDTDSDRINVVSLEQTPSGERVWLGETDVPDREWSDAFIPPSEAVRSALLRALAGFRGERPQQGIRLEVSAVDDNEAGRQVARQIGAALGQYNLGRNRAASAEHSVHITQLRVSPHDRGMVYHLLSALSPYLKGEVWIQYDDNAETMILHLADNPVFGGDGTVWYGVDTQD